MPVLYLPQGSKEVFPSSTVINGKQYKLIAHDSPKSKKLSGMYCIYNDLIKIHNSLKNHIQYPSYGFEHFNALTILYRKCWNDSGFRCFKLEIERDLKNASKTLLDFHKLLIHIGNKYIAHSDKTEYDQCSILLIMENNKAVGIRPNRMTVENLSLDEYQVWLELITYLQNNLLPLLEEMKNAVIDEYNSSMQNDNKPNK